MTWPGKATIRPTSAVTCACSTSMYRTTSTQRSGDPEKTARLSLQITLATEADAAPLAALHNAVAARLTQDYGRGHWSYNTTERGVALAIGTSRVVVARNDGEITGTLALQTKKP